MNALKVARNLGPLGVVEILRKKKVTGRGGAGFPVAKKWKFAMDTDSDVKYLICNADEGEPGTFKDKFIMLKNPKTMIEGIIIAAETIGVKNVYFYLRGEYLNLREGLEKEIKSMLKKSESDASIEIVMGAGAYICGEETAIIKSIEGYRGQPYCKPPFPPKAGLWEKPTVVNNVETFVHIAQSLYFDDYNTNLRLFSISGCVKKPGIYEALSGESLTKVISKAKPTNKPKAIYFGCFGGCKPYKEMKLTAKNICGDDCVHGAATLIITDDKTSAVDMAYIISKFFTYESCGKCTPCREGNIQVLLLLKKLRAGEATKEDYELLKELSLHVQETSLCGLGQTSTKHITTGIKYFESEFTDLIKEDGTGKEE
ncbi:MAG: NADH-quinone oxidoreductase subunit F [Nanoarchaeota archaeon]|nr:NADH-quinone oxidoreductase subunit F [Nanoarchaeota archaeon]